MRDKVFFAATVSPRGIRRIAPAAGLVPAMDFNSEPLRGAQATLRGKTDGPQMALPAGEKIKLSQWLPCPLLLAAAYAGVNANIQGIQSLLPIISREFSLTRAEAGLFSSFYFLSATGVAVFSGRLIDILGPRKGLIFGVASMSIVMMFIALAPFYGIILLLAFVCGLMFSFITPSVSRGIIDNVWYKKRALSMGIAHSGSGAGGMLSAAVLPLIATGYGWRPAIMASAFFALIIGVIIFNWYPESENSNRTNGDGEVKQRFRYSLFTLAANRYFLAVCVFGILLGCVISSVGAHFALFLHTDYNLSPVRSGIGLAVLQIGGIIGMPGWGILSDRLFRGDRYITLVVITIMVAMISLFMVWTLELEDFSYGNILIMALVAGFICLGTMGLFFAVIAESVDEQRTGMATGMALIFSRTGVIFAPPVFGWIADVTNSYRYSWFALATLAVFFCIFLLIARRRCQRHVVS